MSERVDREGELMTLDIDEQPDECLWCGDELRDGKCARHCPSSRRNHVEDRQG